MGGRIVPGVLGAYAAARAMSALLLGVAPGDAATFATAVDPRAHII